MVSITWHTKNTPPKQPFWHMYVVVLCAHGIEKKEFSTLKIGGGGQKTRKTIPYTHTCVWQSTLFEVFVSILEVLEKYSCRILRSIRPYTQKYTGVYLEYTGTFCLPPMPPFSSPTPPPLHLLMTLQPPNTLYTQKSTI